MQPPLPFLYTSKSCYLGMSDNHPLVVTQQVQNRAREQNNSQRKETIHFDCLQLHDRKKHFHA